MEPAMSPELIIYLLGIPVFSVVFTYMNSLQYQAEVNNDDAIIGSILSLVWPGVLMILPFVLWVKITKHLVKKLNKCLKKR